MLPVLLIFIVSFLIVKELRLVFQWTLANYTDIFSKMPYWVAYVRSFRLALTAVVLSAALAYPLAYAIAFVVPAKYRRLLMVAMILPFWTNYLIRAYSWQIILANNGLFNQVFKALKIIETPITILYTHVATEVGFTHFYMVLMTMLLYSSMDAINRNLLEAARDLGANKLRTFFEVIFPLSLPGLFVGSIFVFIMSFGDFVAPSILGGGKKPVFTQMIVDEIQGTVNLSMASALAVIMVVTILIVLIVFLRRAELLTAGKSTG
ncbi:MAG: ABC transporter permease [Desulfobacterales bacterium]|nr:MAG: ABC transporter permease [Desulfobacterales bacterium]